MKLCEECRKKPWPYAIALFISGFVAFVTWLTFSAAGVSLLVSRWATGIAFLLAVIILGTYMVSCMRRHCAEDRHDH
ncbi:MAG TPA: hypothetical protein ENJ80_00285 [Gammaproteobacteria bacterium]|nr:hypothetical protein [Gammaproteobacteria bacterium]